MTTDTNKPKWIKLESPAGAAAKAIAKAAWKIVCDSGETSGVAEWPEGSGQHIWWRGAETGEGCDFADYSAGDYQSTVKSGIAMRWIA
ncbi:MAG: hypothetical protein H0W38_08750 [Methylibium sp.]|nr:hypothetical protein [Methylibium sp.]